MVLIVSLLATGLLWAYLRLVNDAFLRRVHGRVDVATRAVGTHQHHLEARTLFPTLVLAHDPSVASALIKRDRGRATSTLTVSTAAAGMPQTALFDGEGHLLAANWPAQPGNLPPQIASLVEQGLRGASPVGPVPSWRWPGEVAVAAVAPVRAGTKIVGAVLAESLMGNAFVDEVKQITKIDAGVFLGDRRVAASVFDKDGHRLVNAQAVTSSVRRVLTRGEMITDEVTIGGRRYIGRYFPIRSSTGSIIGMFAVGVPFDRLAEDRHRIVRTTIWTSVGALLLAAMAAVGLGYRLLAPIRQLQASAEAIHHGRPESAKFQVTTHDELGDLSTAMAEMVAMLQARERDLVTANAALEEASRHKSEFLSRMSHELRTPLNAILGFGQLLEMDHLSPDQRESVQHILKGGRHLLALIDEVLDIARIEAGRLSMSQEPVSIDDVLKESLTLVGPMTAMRGLHLSSDREEPSSRRHVFADRQRLTQVLLNLLSNAIKYNHEGGSVVVSSEEVTGGRMRVTVTDNGPGIPPDKMARLFTPFDRLGVEETGIEGAGLGLSLSKRLMEAMGGTLGVASTPGQGSTFWIELPIVASPEERMAQVDERLPVPAELEASRKARVVLYIEDNLSNLKLIQRLLVHRPEVRLLPVMQARLGLQLARENNPTLILLDLQLPDISGDEVLRQLRATPETRDIPVAIISADATPGQVKRLRAAGAWRYLTKPLDVKQFLAVLDEALKERELDHAEKHA
jgi:signal transduction histidine kinase/ActR/RegA family two-component response regulator